MLSIFKTFGSKVSQETLKRQCDFYNSVRKILNISHGNNEDIKEISKQFFVDRLLGEVYKLDKNSSNLIVLDAISNKVNEILKSEDFKYKVSDDSRERIEYINRRCHLPIIGNSDSNVYGTALNNNWIDTLGIEGIDEIFEGKSEQFKFPSTVTNEEDLYKYFKIAVTDVLRNHIIGPYCKNDQEFYERLTNEGFLPSMVNMIHDSNRPIEEVLQVHFRFKQ